MKEPNDGTQAGYKACTLCRVTWPSRDAFLDDPEIALLGYQAFVEDGIPGLFLFNHACGTTLALPLESMRDLYHGPPPQPGRVGPEGPVDYCLTSQQGSCPATCECALVRQLTDLLKPIPDR